MGSGYRRRVPDPPLTTLHLFGVPARAVPVAVARMALDRRWLARTAGLRFSKLLGTGSGRTFTVRDADPLRWGLLAVWDDAAALAAFERGSPVSAAWRRIAGERWRADLRVLRVRGSWAGRQPFGTPAGRADHAGPVAAITRARLRPARTRRFWRAVPPVVADLAAAPGLRFTLGVGEAPVGLQGTFSVWESSAALAAFAYGGAAHRDVVRRTPAARWYTEELFARFAVLQATGTVDGGDPLHGLGP